MKAQGSQIVQFGEPVNGLRGHMLRNHQFSQPPQKWLGSATAFFFAAPVAGRNWAYQQQRACGQDVRRLPQPMLMSVGIILLAQAKRVRFMARVDDGSG